MRTSIVLRSLPLFAAMAFAGPAYPAALTLVTTDPLNFGNILVGSSASLNVTVQNSGTTGTGNCNNNQLCVRFGPAVDDGGNEFVPDTEAASVGPLVAGATASRSYTYTPTARQTDSATVTVRAVGTDGTTTNTNFPAVSLTLTGKGVAAQNDVTSVDAGEVRVGTAGSATVTVENVGDGNLSGLGSVSNLKGTMSGPVGSAAFSGPSPNNAIDLADAGSKVFTYGFAPTARGGFSADVTAGFTNGKSDGTNAAENVVTTILGTGVGPVFDSSVTPGDTIDFGLVVPGGFATFDLTVANITLDLGLDIELNGLSLLDAVFSGDDAGLFSIVGGFTPLVLDPDDVAETILTLRFDAPMLPGRTFNAVLTLLTDEGAEFGGEGADFSFNLTAGTLRVGDSHTVPEPAALGLLGVALLGLAGGLRLRRRD